MSVNDRRDQRLIQSENAIIEAGIKTLLINPDAGMAAIAISSGVGRTTLYRHYESKQTLLQAIAAKCLVEIDDALLPVHELRGRQALEATFELLLPLADRYRFLSSLWSQVEGDPSLVAKLEQYSGETEWLIEQAMRDGTIDGDLPVKWVRTFFDMTLYAGWSLLESGEATAEEAVAFATRSFFNGCGALTRELGPE